MCALSYSHASDKLFKLLQTRRLSIFTAIISLGVGYLFAVLTLNVNPRDDSVVPAQEMMIKKPQLPDAELIGICDQLQQREENRVALQIASEVRVLCFILMTRGSTKAEHVKATWGRRCNKLLFMSTEEDTRFPVVKLPVTEGHDYLWGKTKASLKYIYEHHLDDAEWFFKADDDTYTILENLRYFLRGLNASERLYLGLRLRPNVKNGYMNGGSGYVLSREAVKRIVEVGLPNGSLCIQEDKYSEDMGLGQCIENVGGIELVETRDSQRRGRFLNFMPDKYLVPGAMPKDFWWWIYPYYNFTPGVDCCSDTAVSFHYISPNKMHLLEYLIYRLHPYGITHRADVNGKADIYIIPKNSSGRRIILGRTWN